MIPHKTAEVDKTATIGEGTKIWHLSQIREHVVIGKNCVIAKNVYIDKRVMIGDNCKIQNNVSVYHGVTIEDGVFIGPHVCLSNDKLPRAVTPDGKLMTDNDWEEGKILIRSGASIGAGSVVLPGVTIGRWAMVGAGSVVTKNVPDHGLVYGLPATLHGYVCACGGKLKSTRKGIYRCIVCGREVTL